jgi:hypothetical protein
MVVEECEWIAQGQLGPFFGSSSEQRTIAIEQRSVPVLDERSCRVDRKVALAQRDEHHEPNSCKQELAFQPLDNRCGGEMTWTFQPGAARSRLLRVGSAGKNHFSGSKVVLFMAD